MHHIFEVDEIIRLIASHLVDTGSEGTALALACSHRSLSTPVLDTLWEQGQTNFVELLKTFPSTAWVVASQTFVSPSRDSSLNMI